MSRPTFKVDREPPGDWIKRGACVGVDPELFFPERGNNALDAKAVCRECPVSIDCRVYGMGESFGVWGGLTQLERERIRRKRRQLRLRVVAA